ncbi:hypothetical protein F511_26486 [Dorcoceras hygrometricum]|uniref:Uncharacterized protein n=1 Tax=Dorcoceras hygrometricum TaxID=472368 RepID=A0A2Z7BH04_9LAMI|nr:hypothetical protein F511_26486 [Dorcoceras hygrometricum]
MSASGESSTTMHRLLHASGSHPIPPPNDPNARCVCVAIAAVSLALLKNLLPAFGRFARDICCQLVERCGVVLFSWNGVVLVCEEKCNVWLLLLVLLKET